MKYGDNDINCSWCIWNTSQKIGKKTGGIESQRLLVKNDVKNSQVIIIIIMKLTIIPIMIGAFGTVTKGLLKGLEDLEFGGRVETIQTTSLLKMARILRRVLET